MKSYVYPAATSTARALIRYIIDMMNREPERIFYLAFSGGTTPSLMFDIWAHEFREETPWMRMRIFWVDERCVSVSDSDSNYEMVLVFGCDCAARVHAHINRKPVKKVVFIRNVFNKLRQN